MAKVPVHSLIPLLALAVSLSASPLRAETLVSASSGDKATTQLTAMLSGLQLVSNDQLTAKVREFRFLEQKYGIDSFLLVAIVEREQQWPTAAPGHAFAYNLKNGMLDFTGTASLPNPMADLDTCAYALKLEKDRYPKDPNSAIVAYFAGPSQVDQWKGNYPSDIKGLLNNIWAMVKTYRGPLKDSQKSPAPAHASGPHGRGAFPSRGGVDRAPLQSTSYARAVDESYRTSTVPPDAVEDLYVQTMQYFNHRIHEDVARAIYQSVASYAHQYEGSVDARLVMALVATESNFNPHAVSRVGAQGLGQLMPYTADSLNVEDPFDIDANIRGTYAYLDNEFRHFAGQDHVLDRVLAGYNAGIGAVDKYNGIPPYQETQNYVRRVVNIYCAILQPFEREAHIRGNTLYDSQLLDGYQH